MPNVNSLEFSERYRRLADKLREGSYPLEQLEGRYERLKDAAAEISQAADARLLWAQALIAKNDFAQALRVLDETRSLKPSSAQMGIVMALFAKIMLLLNQPREALDYIDRSLKLLGPWSGSNELDKAEAMKREIEWQIKHPNPRFWRRIGHSFTRAADGLMVAELA